MKIPKIINTYCKYCKKHTAHSVSQARVKERGSLKKGSIQRAMKRGLGKGHGNLGKYGSKPAISKWKRTGAKGSKRVDLRLKCNVCNKTTVKATRSRVKKFSLE
ncbi:50S ribosomal protein L44e [Candidatus Woesearchaeota archaeon]|nr:50S ribosomal protein L44e [Candidatus Woesearchaeota archaeon]